MRVSGVRRSLLCHRETASFILTQMAGNTRSPSAGPPSAQQHSRRRASRSPSVAGDSGSRPRQRDGPPRNRRRGGQQQPAGGIGGLPGVDEVADTVTGTVGTAGDTVGGLVHNVGDTVGGVASGVGDAVGGLVDGLAGLGGDKPLKLRLDLNLDVAVELKASISSSRRTYNILSTLLIQARVHGDLTISLL